MKRFFGRRNELSLLREIEAKSHGISQFTVLSGNRRIGKTALVREAYGYDNFLYFFVSKKSEAELCEIFQQETEAKLGVNLFGKATRFEELLRYIMQASKSRPVTIFIDEFQVFQKIDSSIYSDIQKTWDIYKNEAQINLIVAGSNKTMLMKLFEGSHEPLFGRQTQSIRLQPFTPSVLKEILGSYNPKYNNDDLLALYSVTGGVARYVELLMDAGAVTKKRIYDEIFREHSMFITEGRNHLIEEFGKDYGLYFSILTAIATGHYERSQIEEIVGAGVGGQLSSLEEIYGMIAKHQPLFATSKKNTKYLLHDNFYIFWFRYIFKYNYMIEIGAWQKLRQIVDSDYETFTGKSLERYFHDLFVERQQHTRLGQWWSRNGETEIDLIAIDEISNTAEFYEIKRKKKDVSLALIEHRKEVFLAATHQLKEYSVSSAGLSMDDM